MSKRDSFTLPYSVVELIEIYAEVNDCYWDGRHTKGVIRVPSDLRHLVVEDAKFLEPIESGYESSDYSHLVSGLGVKEGIIPIMFTDCLYPEYYDFERGSIAPLPFDKVS